jgi:hypothetical protein
MTLRGVCWDAQIQIMSGQHPPNGETDIAAIPKGLRILAMFLRALVFGALVAMTVHLSSPQSETIWTVYDTPGDLIRLALGFAICLWLGASFRSASTDIAERLGLGTCLSPTSRTHLYLLYWSKQIMGSVVRCKPKPQQSKATSQRLGRPNSVILALTNLR